MSQHGRLAKPAGWLREMGKRWCQGLRGSAGSCSAGRFASRKCDRPAADDIATMIGLIEHLEQIEPDGYSFSQLPTQP